MSFFGMLFWLVVLWFAFRAFRSWSCGSRGNWGDPPVQRGEDIEDQRPYIESLESRIAELEERLEFTERLVAERSSPSLRSG